MVLGELTRRERVFKLIKEKLSLGEGGVEKKRD